MEDNLLTTFDTLPNQWKVTFKLKPNNLTLKVDPWGDWLNIFLMTNWAGDNMFGNRNPKITFTSHKGLLVCSAVGDKENYCTEGFEEMFSVGSWTKLEVSQEFEEAKLMYKVVINNARVFYKENNLRGTLKNMKVYASQGQQRAFPGHIKDLSIFVKSGQCVDNSGRTSVFPIVLPSNGGSNSPSSCVARCFELGHAFAGVENSETCSCGDSHPTTITCTSECSLDCPGDSGHKCGGVNMMNVWPTPLESNLLDKPITGPDADAPPEEIEAAFNAISSAQSEAIQAGLASRECLFPNNDETRLEENKGSEDDTATSAPPIDIFINPGRSSELKNISATMMKTAKKYFRTSDMSSLYPELLRTLWDYTLPCFPEPGMEQAMLRRCTLGGLEIPCNDIFKRVPTDSGLNFVFTRKISDIF